MTSNLLDSLSRACQKSKTNYINKSDDLIIKRHEIGMSGGSWVATNRRLIVGMTTKCIICKVRPRSSAWLYKWNGLYGNACEYCGKMFHEVGGYLGSSARRYFESKGIVVLDSKEKFGIWNISLCYTKKQEKVIKERLKLYNEMFPEFTFDWL